MPVLVNVLPQSVRVSRALEGRMMMSRGPDALHVTGLKIGHRRSLIVLCNESVR